jgi:RimJ/RimL family protein N-acetyltransferase
MAVLPIDTERLHLRLMRSSDAAVLAGYRSLPEVARFQGWGIPYTVDDAASMLTEQDGLDDVTAGRWVQIAIERRDSRDPSGSAVVGDLAVGLTDDAFVASIGYTLAPPHEGNGYASEAAEALVDALFERTDVHRVTAALDPQNVSSMRVVEPLGFREEGVARRSELVRGEWLDDMRFALLRDERAAWKARNRAVPTDVRLVEVQPGEGRQWAALQTHRFQRRFVSTVAESFADAAAPGLVDGAPVVPWFRGIEADGDKVGFVMVAAVTDTHPDPYLWRLLIDRSHQRRGIGIAVVRQLIARFRDDGCRRLMVSYGLGPGSPEPLYRGLGFVPTGDETDGEIVAALTL